MYKWLELVHNQHFLLYFNFMFSVVFFAMEVQGYYGSRAFLLGTAHRKHTNRLVAHES